MEEIVNTIPSRSAPIRFYRLVHQLMPLLLQEVANRYPEHALTIHLIFQGLRFLFQMATKLKSIKALKSKV